MQSPSPSKSSSSPGDRRSLGRANAVVVALLSPEQQQQLWAKHQHERTEISNDSEPIPFSPCWIWKGSEQNGYPVQSMGHAKSKVKIHILAYAVANDGCTPDSGQVVSHLCHRKLCFRPEHLVIESITNNNARKGCLRAFTVGNDIYNLCWHERRCLRRDTDTVGNFKPETVLLLSSQELIIDSDDM